MLWGGISFAIYPVGLALLGQRFRGGDMARANTAFSLLYIVGGLIGRPLTGAAMDAVRRPRPRLDAGDLLRRRLHRRGRRLAPRPRRDFCRPIAVGALLALRRPG